MRCDRSCQKQHHRSRRHAKEDERPQRIRGLPRAHVGPNTTSGRLQKLTNWAIAMPTPIPAGNDTNRMAIATFDLMGVEQLG